MTSIGKQLSAALLALLLLVPAGSALAQTPGAFFAGKNGCKLWWTHGNDSKNFTTMSAEWRGTCRNGLAQGHGTFAVVVRYQYEQDAPLFFHWTGEGDVVDGKLSGRAFYVSDTGHARTEGEFRDGVLNGRGITTSEDETSKSRSEGEYRDGSLNGWAVREGEDLYSSDTVWFAFRQEGEFRSGALNGKGVAVRGPRGCAVQQRYEGEFAAGLFNGRGTLKAYNGKIYSGVWEKGVLNGESASFKLSRSEDALARCR